MILFLLFSGQGSAKTITVDDDGNADHILIQDAIDASEDGDIIHILRGTYTENLKITKSLFMYGIGSDGTIIQPPTETTGILLMAEDVQITGLSIIGTGENGDYAGIRVNYDDFRLEDLVISNCSYGIVVYGASGDINRVECHNNSQHGINIRESVNVEVIESLCEFNGMAGIRADQGTFDSLIQGNYLYNNHYGMDVSGNNITIQWNECANNSDNIYLGERSNEIRVEDNACRGGNRGIVSFGTGNSIDGNDCSYLEQCISLRSGSASSVIANNTLTMSQLGISVSGRDHRINDNIITSNHMGIDLVNANFSHILKNVVSFHEIGIQMDISHNNLVEINEVKESSSCGFKLLSSNFNDIRNNSIYGNEEHGIRINGANNNSLVGNRIQDNRIGILLERSSSRNLILHNVISGNSKNGINAISNDGIVVNATLNNWGHSSGPHNIQSNPSGSGDKVTDLVIFIPWLISGTNESCTSNVSGVVVDIYNEPLSLVIVTLRYLNIEDIAVTDSNGEFEFTNVPNINTKTNLSIYEGAYHDHVTDLLLDEDVELKIILQQRQPYMFFRGISPTNNSYVRGIVTLDGSIRHYKDLPVKVQMKINGGEWIVIANDTSWSYELDTTPYPNDVLILSFRIDDGYHISDPQNLSLLITNKYSSDDGMFDTIFYIQLLSLAFIIAIISAFVVKANGLINSSINANQEQKPRPKKPGSFGSWGKEDEHRTGIMQRIDRLHDRKLEVSESDDEEQSELSTRLTEEDSHDLDELLALKLENQQQDLSTDQDLEKDNVGYHDTDHDGYQDSNYNGYHDTDHNGYQDTNYEGRQDTDYDAYHDTEPSQEPEVSSDMAYSPETEEAENQDTYDSDFRRKIGKDVVSIASLHDRIEIDSTGHRLLTDPANKVRGDDVDRDTFRPPEIKK